MNVQLIGYRKANIQEFPDIFLSSLDAPKSLDEFDINVIDLSSPDLWKNRGESTMSIDSINDFVSIQTMVTNKTKSGIVYVFPRNVLFYCDRHGSQGQINYWKSFKLKDQIDSIANNILWKIIPHPSLTYKLLFENTRTNINGMVYEGDFYFECESGQITKSNQSEKTTTVRLTDNQIYATTLQITESQDSLLHFLEFLFKDDQTEATPEWVHNIEFGNDCEQSTIIATCKKEIEKAQEKIDLATDELKNNLKYKSILYTSGNELVRVVFDILEQIMDCDLSEFVDELNEDFLIKKENCTFIGEIKGVTSNVKNEHISQVEVHYQNYMDKLEEDGQEEHVHQILIINPFRNKELSQREPVNDKQVKLADRNGCLIVETETLLRIFEKFLSGEVTATACINVFSTCKGLLTLDAFDKEDPEELASYMV